MTSTTAPQPYLLEFNALDHIYTVAGVAVPSVTQVLSSMGLYPHYPATQEAQSRRDFGTRVHEYSVLSDNGMIDDVPEEYKGCCAAWLKFITDYKVSIIETEVQLYSTVHEYAGTIDRVAKIDGRLAVVDLKTGDPGRVAGLQLAAYAQLWFEESGSMARRLMAVQVLSNGTYKVSEYDPVLHSRVWLAAMTLHAWRDLQ